MFFGDNRSAEIEKDAQIGLLKAAKLIGFSFCATWLLVKTLRGYEESDWMLFKSASSRSISPVSGRGRRRLKSCDSLTNVLENATAAESSFKWVRMVGFAAA